MALTKIDDRGLKTPVDLLDNEKIRLGTGNDLEIYHDGSNSYLQDAGTGALRVQSNDARIINAAGSEDMARFIENGSVELYHDNSKKLETTAGGATVHCTDANDGFIVQGDVRFRKESGVTTYIKWDGSDEQLEVFDDVKVSFGDDHDLQIYHDGNSRIDHDGGGSLIIRTIGSGEDIQLYSADDILLRPQAGEDGINIIGNGTVQLYYDNSKKFETWTSGARIPLDNGVLAIGAGDDLRFWHNATNSIIRNATGQLQIQSNDLRLGNYNFTETYIKALEDGAVELYYDNGLKFKTTSAGAMVVGGEGSEATLEIYADEGDDNADKWRIRAETSGNLNIQNMASGSWETNLTLLGNGAVELRHDNTKKFETTSYGVEVHGGLELPDSAGGTTANRLKIGAGDDLQVFHNGTNSIISNQTGDLSIRSDNNIVFMDSGANETFAKFVDNGAVELYYDNSKKFETTSWGVDIHNTLRTNEILMYDHHKIRLGDSNDLEIYHDGTKNHLYTNLASEYAIYIANDGANTNRYGLSIQCGSDDATGTNYAMSIADGNGTAQGQVTFTGGTITWGTFTAHHPCIVPDADNPSDDSMAYPYGTLLETISIEYSKDKDGADTERGIRYKVQKTQSANSKKVLGAYGSSMNGGPNKNTNEHQALVLGDGHILCNNAGGNIEVGDGICSSSTAGIGQKATVNPSMIIGIAQEAVTFTGSETKLVAVQYGLQQFIPWT